MENLDRSIAPPFQTIEKLNIIEAQTQMLQNGIALHTINAGKQELLKLEIIFHTGSFEENITGQAFFTSKMLNEGTKNRSAHQISEDIDQYGAFLEIVPGTDRLSIAVYTLSKYLDSIISIVEDIILESTFPEDELETIKQITTQNIKVNLNKTSYLASRLYKQMLFGENHPYGKMLDQSTVQSINKTQLFNFYEKFIKNKSCEVILVGKIEDKHIKALDSTLGQWKLSAVNSSNISNDAFELPTPNKKYQALEDKVQSSIRLGKSIQFATMEEKIDLSIVNEILGGYYGSRLMKNIREDKGYTYGIYARLTQQVHAKYMTISTDVNKEFMQNTLNEIYKEIEILQTTPIENSELETVRNYSLGALASSLSTCFDLAELFKAVHYNNWDYGFYQKYVTRIKTITPDEIQAIAKKHFALDSFTEAVVG